MHIGILTFHWATNYGAILQCYALQTYLESLGHDVKIINYKPHMYDQSLYWVLRHRKFLHPIKFIKSWKQERCLIKFRNKHLKLTQRIYTFDTLNNAVTQFEAIISGSDQVLNPSFLMEGEGAHHITPTYFLGFPFNGIRIGYALSFGCISYPEKALQEARKYIGAFDMLSVRESSGTNIAISMGRHDSVVVPDPTILMESAFYHSMADEDTPYNNKSYTYCFFIRHVTERKQSITTLLKDKDLVWNTDDKIYSIEGWLAKIKNAAFVITDSFHCMVMCLKLHTPFAVITDLPGNAGMNDRFFTLLERVSLTDRITHKNKTYHIQNLLTSSINWNIVDERLNEYKTIGTDYLKRI